MATSRIKTFKYVITKAFREQVDKRDKIKNLEKANNDLIAKNKKIKQEKAEMNLRIGKLQSEIARLKRENTQLLDTTVALSKRVFGG